MKIKIKYYGIKGFKKAIKGKRYIRLGWDDIQGKYVSLSFPVKSTYAYWVADSTALNDDADWADYADAVTKFIETDIDDIPGARQIKSKLNL